MLSLHREQHAGKEACSPSSSPVRDASLPLPTGVPSFLEPAYSPALLPRGEPYARLFPGNVPVYAEPMHYMASVQSFSRGGYEVVIRCVDAQKMAEQSCLVQPPRRRDVRPEDERDLRDISRAQFRAKKKVRHTVKEMAADRIVTLTTRQSENTPEELLERWQRWLRLVERASGGRFHYVAVPEPHPSNPKHFHLHVAVAVFLNVDILRRCWWAVCGGRGMGNIHIKRLKSGAGHRRVYRVASYISKYLTKDNVVRFNKKRYWASRVDLPAAKHYWLRSRTLSEALMEAFQRFRFLPETPRDVWINEGAGIAWMQAAPGIGADPPF